MAAMRLLEIDGLTKRFGGVTALNHVALGVVQGSITGIVGPNGSGKTTLFNCVSGLLTPNEGDVLLSGRQLRGLAPDAIARLGVGRTFQTTRVFDDLTVADNLRAGALFSPRGSVAEGMRTLELFGLQRFAQDRAGTLSYGQQKLVELAVVMTLRPLVVLLDEPAAGVNPDFVARLASYVRELNQEGVTFVVVEHNMPFVFDLCDPVAVLDQGRVIAEGSPSEIQSNQRVLDAYLGAGTRA